VSPRTCLDGVEKRKLLTLPGLELRPLGCPARSQSLYLPRYPGSYTLVLTYSNIGRVSRPGPGLRLKRNLSRYSGAVAIAALWESWRMTHSKYVSSISNKNLRVLLGTRRFDKMQCAFYSPAAGTVVA
jgi:hypothetical protein